jgi:hypothetical protein
MNKKYTEKTENLLRQMEEWMKSELAVYDEELSPYQLDFVTYTVNKKTYILGYNTITGFYFTANEPNTEIIYLNLDELEGIRNPNDLFFFTSVLNIVRNWKMIKKQVENFKNSHETHKEKEEKLIKEIDSFNNFQV